MQEEKNKIETILFTTGRFMALQEIADLCGIGSVGTVKEIVEELIKDYGSREGSLEIFEEKGKYKLSIKKKYNYLTSKLLDVAEMDAPTQKTLAVIAYKQPSIQAEVIKIRGNKAYDHIGNLKEMDFVTAEKFGRTKLLKLTQKFFDYFDLVEDKLKEKFSNLEKLEEQTKDIERQLDADPKAIPGEEKEESAEPQEEKAEEPEEKTEEVDQEQETREEKPEEGPEEKKLEQEDISEQENKTE